MITFPRRAAPIQLSLIPALLLFQTSGCWSEDDWSSQAHRRASLPLYQVCLDTPHAGHSKENKQSSACLPNTPRPLGKLRDPRCCVGKSANRMFNGGEVLGLKDSRYKTPD